MSHPKDSKQSICGDPRCPGLSCQGCQAFIESVVIHESIQCPDKVSSCRKDNLCNMCKATAQSLVETKGQGGKAPCYVMPLQAVHGSSNQEQCDECKQPFGSNTQCGFCASFAKSPLNPAQPDIQYHPNFGPIIYSFGPFTDSTAQNTLKSFQRSFEAAKKNEFPFTGITSFRRRASLIKMLLSQGVIIGFEGFDNSCFLIVVFWMLSQGNMHERINIDCLSGHILYKILWDLLFGLFVGRDIVAAFRLSLQEYPSVQRNMSENGMDDPNCVLVILEDLGILRKGPILSVTGCSFHIHEVRGENPVSSIQEALCASVSSPSPVLEDGSIASFQFSQQRGGNGRFMGQTLGTDFKFPHNGLILAGKLLIPKMFIIYTSEHYFVVLWVGEAFFLSNSLSASNCGHFLPETREISEAEAMDLFITQAHTIVFECVGNVPPPPVSCASGPWFLPPPPPAPCVSSGCVPPPPIQVHCAQDHWVPSPPPPAPCAQVAQTLPPPPQAADVQVAHSVQKLNMTDVDMIYTECKWFLNTKGRQGIQLATGDIIGSGKTCQYKFGESVFSSKDELEIALQARYGKIIKTTF